MKERDNRLRAPLNEEVSRCRARGAHEAPSLATGSSGSGNLLDTGVALRGLGFEEVRRSEAVVRSRPGARGGARRAAS
jgi:hypothetical protein